MGNTFKRAFYRAPLKTTILYTEGDYVFKARLLNISEGGVLLENLPQIPENDSLAMLLNIPLYPNFRELNSKEIMLMNSDDFDRDILRFKARLVRKFEGESEVDSLFVTKVGCQFFDSSEVNTKLIQNFVSQTTKNIVFLLNLFEAASKDIDFIRKIAELLKYTKDEKVSVLRQKILHDYQSLESL